MKRIVTLLTFGIILVFTTNTAIGQDIGFADITMDPIIVNAPSTANKMTVQLVNQSVPQPFPAYRAFVTIDAPSGFTFTGLAADANNNNNASWALYSINNGGKTINIYNKAVWDGSNVFVHEVVLLYDASITPTETTITGNITWGDGTANMDMLNGGTNFPGAGSQPTNDVTDNNKITATLKSLVLPVVFGELNASIKDNMLYVNWSTEMEKYNKYFVIEASKDGKTFVNIDSVNTKATDGNSDQKLEYSFSKSITSAVAKLGIGLHIGVYGMFAYLVAALALFIVAFGNVNRPNRRKIGSFIIAICLVGTAAITGCRKEKQQVEVDSTLPEKVFVRITQVDTDGTRVSGKVVQAVKE